MALKFLVPFALGFGGIQSGTDQQQNDVFRRGLEYLLQNPAPIPKFAGGQMNLNATLFSE